MAAHFLVHGVIEIDNAVVVFEVVTGPIGVALSEELLLVAGHLQRVAPSAHLGASDVVESSGVDDCGVGVRAVSLVESQCQSSCGVLVVGDVLAGWSVAGFAADPQFGDFAVECGGARSKLSGGGSTHAGDGERLVGVVCDQASGSGFQETGVGCHRVAVDATGVPVSEVA